MWSFSPNGSAPVTYARSTPLTTTSQMVGVVAPGVVTLFPDITRVAGTVPPDRFSATSSTGTSWSAGLVAGGFALQTEAFREAYGGLGPRGGIGLAAALLGGDAWGAATNTRVMPPDARSGFGRYRAIAPDTLAGSGWGFRGGWMSPGTYEFTVNTAGPETGVRQWRWVALHIGERMDAVSGDFVIEAVDSCNGNAVVASDYSFNLRKRIWLDHAAICPSGAPSCRCLVMRFTILAPAGATAQFYMADFFHSGTEVL